MPGTFFAVASIVSGLGTEEKRRGVKKAKNRDKYIYIGVLSDLMGEFFIEAPSK